MGSALNVTVTTIIIVLTSFFFLLLTTKALREEVTSGVEFLYIRFSVRTSVGHLLD